MGKTAFILGMRDRFFDALFAIARKDPNVVIISADNGAPSLDKFAFELKNQFYTVGIAEQHMIGMAAGMATEGKKVYTYAIAPFVTTRVHEQNKLDLCAMNLPVVNLGVGAGYAYDIMGPSHHTVEDLSIMRVLPNLTIFSPADGSCAEKMAEFSYRLPGPQYIRFDRAGLPEIYDTNALDVARGFTELVKGRDLCIVATGIFVHQAIKVAKNLRERKGLDVGVVDLFRIKPLPTRELLETLAPYRALVTYEEHLIAGGMGSALLEMVSDHGAYRPTLRIGQEDRFVFENGGREVIWKKYGLDAIAVSARILGWLPKADLNLR